MVSRRGWRQVLNWLSRSRFLVYANLCTCRLSSPPFCPPRGPSGETLHVPPLWLTPSRHGCNRPGPGGHGGLVGAERRGRGPALRQERPVVRSENLGGRQSAG